MGEVKFYLENFVEIYFSGLKNLVKLLKYRREICGFKNPKFGFFIMQNLKSNIKKKFLYVYIQYYQQLLLHFFLNHSLVN